MLPELGVTEKKTHSSSIDEPVALEVKRRLTGESQRIAGRCRIARTRKPRRKRAADAARAEAVACALGRRSTNRSGGGCAASPRRFPRRLAPLPRASAPRCVRRWLRMPGHAASARRSRRAAFRFRPGLLRRLPRPGQILSGPRQPSAGRISPGRSAARPAEPSPQRRLRGAAAGAGHAGTPRTRVPSMPAPPSAPRPAAPPAATIVPGAPMGGGSPLRPPAKPNLAGQPAARPIVPPRPDMVAKLTRPPGAGRSGERLGPECRRARRVRFPASRFIWSGSSGPAADARSRPGPGGYPAAVRGGPGGLRGRGRPMHPTSPLRAEPATLPTDPGRRHATKPGSRDRRRDVDPEEGRIRPGFAQAAGV